MASVSSVWVDTHCHLDAAEFDADREQVVGRARAAGVGMQVVPAVNCAGLAGVSALALRFGLAYALGLHPLYVGREPEDALTQLAQALARCHDDPRLVAVGEIGLDGFVPGLDMALQERFYVHQLQMARECGLPVILHVRRSADQLLKHLRRIPVAGGIAHAFNGSLQQAQVFVDLGFKLGFGGTLTYDRALQIRRLAAALPLDALVLETDAPDIPPHWLYRTAGQRAQAALQGAATGSGRNEPAELPRIAESLAVLRGLTPSDLALHTTRNAVAALPRLAGLLASVTGVATC